MAQSNQDPVVHVHVDGSCLNNGSSKARSHGGVGVFFADGDPRNLSLGYAMDAAGARVAFAKQVAAPVAQAAKVIETLLERVTNQTMELAAALHALELLLQPGSPKTIVVHTDSVYTIKCATLWVRAWRANGWRTASKQPVKNAALIARLADLVDRGGVTFAKVRGHARAPPATDPRYRDWYGNHRADQLANEAATAMTRYDPGAARIVW